MARSVKHTPRRAKTDTATGVVATLAAIQEGDILPPSHVRLREQDLPFWRSIVRARARELWTDADLEIAANLARCKADIERIQEELDVEGNTLINQRGTPVMNPKHTILETLSRRSVALSKMILVHAIATIGESHSVGSALKRERQLESEFATFSADLDLIPTQVMVHA